MTCWTSTSQRRPAQRGGSENFYAHFKTSVYLENKPYVFRIMRDNGVRVWGTGSLLLAKTRPRVGDPDLD